MNTVRNAVFEKGVRKLLDTTPMNFLESILVPLKDETTNTWVKGEFVLDAMTVFSGGFHHIAIVRCGESKKWVVYDDMKHRDNQTLQQVKGLILEGFETMKTKKFEGGNRPEGYTPNTHAQLLFYSRVKKD